MLDEYHPVPSRGGFMSRPPGKYVSRAFTIGVGCALVFLSGLWLGRLSADSGEVLSGAAIDRGSGLECNSQSTRAAGAAPASEPAGAGLIASSHPATDASVLRETGSQGWDKALARNPRGVLARRIFDMSRDPQVAVDFLIDQMSDEELTDVISGVTNLTGEDISSMHDPREFAARLSSIALQTAYAEPGADEWDLDPVHFAKRVAPDNSPDRPSLDFERGTRRIYAVFPSEHSKADEVMVKWYRTDRPELLMLKKHRIAPHDDQSFVWLEQNGGWPSGEYAVEFFTSDERLARIATGQFTVR